LEKKSFRGNFIGDQSIYLVKKKLPVNKVLYLLFHCKNAINYER